MATILTLMLVILILIITNLITLHRYKYKNTPPVYLEYIGGVLVVATGLLAVWVLIMFYFK